MATFADLTREEKIGLAVATAAHVALAAALMLQPDASRDYTIPARMDVSLATDVSLESTAPDPSQDAAASASPEISEMPMPDPASAVEAPRPEPVPQPPQRPRPQARAPQTAQPPPTPAPAPAPTARATPAPAPRERTTGTRVNDNFLEGMGSGESTDGSPAAQAGPAERASIVQAINRQLKPKWNPPSGVEVDKLVTVVRFRLNRDGSLSGNPTVVRTTGQTDSNRAQVGRHQEQAVRAVRTASPFNLPEQYYSVWQDLEWNFDNRLAQ